MMEPRTARIDLRVTESEKCVLTQAAATKGVSLSQFILSSSRTVADELLAEQSRFGLSSAQLKALNEALDAEPRTIEGLAALFQRPDPFQR